MAPRMSIRGVSIGLVLSYAFDWLIVVLMAAVGSGVSLISPYNRPFSLGNPELSYPHPEVELISLSTLILVSLVAPAAIIAAVALLFVPGPTVPKSTPARLIWQRKLWEWFSGWLGLGFSLASTWLIVSGTKNLFGKPRPDVIARCMPDIANMALHLASNYPNTPANAQLVRSTICQQPDKRIFDEGFRSFPSGHSSFSAAGLIYLSLFLASKLAITLPFLAPAAFSSERSQYSAFPSRLERRTPAHQAERSADSTKTSTHLVNHTYATGHDDALVAARNQAAAPPVYLFVFPFIPFFAAVYVSATRYTDFQHHGFDILSGFTIGLVMAVLSFRFYHLPISQGAGWSWGPRSRNRAFWAGVGRGSYVGGDDDAKYGVVRPESIRHEDLEMGPTSSSHEQQQPHQGMI